MMRESETDDEELLNGRRGGAAYQWKKAILSRKNRTCVRFSIIASTLLIVIGIIILAVGLTHHKPTTINKLNFGWDQVFNSSFSSKSKDVSWDIQGDLLSFLDENRNIVGYLGNSLNTTVILDIKSLKAACPASFPICESFQGYKLSSDRNWIALSYGHRAIYRHSYDAKWLLVKLNLTSPIVLQVFNNETLSVFSWSPSKTLNDSLLFSFVNKHDLYVGKINGDDSISFDRLSQDGSENILNGICDWVYEEEVFSASPASWWDPSSSQIVYLRLDDTNVPIYDYEYYDEKNSTYPQLVQIKYPKVDAKNPVASVILYSIATQTKVALNIPVNFEYVTSVQWENSTSFLVTVVPRLQNSETILRFNVADSNGIVLITRNEPGWIEQTPLLIMDQFLLRVVPDNNKGGFRHIAQYDRKSGSLLRFLTSGPYDVSQIVGYSPVSQRLYFISSQVSSVERHVYSLLMSDSNQVTQLFDLSGTYSASLNPSGNVLLVAFSSPDSKNPSTQTTYSINPDGSVAKILDLVDNSGVVQLRNAFNYVDKQWMTLKTADGQDMNAAVTFPPSFDGKGEYCLLVSVYGGPESQMATKRDYFFGFAPYLATSLKCLVASIDGRGTGARGSTFSKSVFQKLGTLETEDQIEGVKQLMKKYPIAKNKVGIWGGSYGGYMTLKSISRHETPFSFGVSMAPVTDWRFYDTFYTEKYMQTSAVNSQGYAATSLIEDSDGIKRMNAGESPETKAKFLLIHGIADDNVHFQNSAELVKVLVNNNVQFESFYYPNRNHGLRTDVKTGENNVQKHLLKMTYNFFFNRVK